jgi:predicted  nucleic acid-binding Zn-ribbon protein
MPIRRKGQMTDELDPLDLLEKKIAQLVKAYAALKNEKNAFGERLAQKDMEIDGLQKKFSLLHQERERAREKLENLIHRLDRLIGSEE